MSLLCFSFGHCSNCQASQENAVVDFKDWQIPLGRRFRSLKLWLVLRLYGVANLQSYIRNHIRLAEQFEQLITSDSRFEVLSGNFILRFAVGAPLTEDRHIKTAWQLSFRRGLNLAKLIPNSKHSSANETTVNVELEDSGTLLSRHGASRPALGRITTTLMNKSVDRKTWDCPRNPKNY
ncbi:MYB family transcription factor [Musa troglodytarum]|uniref:MYB family transcription factor n=1 Tax=Musa troglodytarum TaxID=320322 RepID=A0A9E7ELL9_9LILI|nr:MYB family transcription factor [Musa troglodytarum]